MAEGTCPAYWPWSWRVLRSAPLFRPHQTQSYASAQGEGCGRGLGGALGGAVHTWGHSHYMGTERLSDLPTVTCLGIKGTCFGLSLSESQLILM